MLLAYTPGASGGNFIDTAEFKSVAVESKLIPEHAYTRMYRDDAEADSAVMHTSSWDDRSAQWCKVERTGSRLRMIAVVFPSTENVYRVSCLVRK